VFIVVEAIGRLTGGGHGLESCWYIFVVIVVALLIDASRILVSLRTARTYSSAALHSNAFHLPMVGAAVPLVGAVLAAFPVRPTVAWEQQQLADHTPPGEQPAREAAAARRVIIRLGDGATRPGVAEPIAYRG
jgi:hypothetical protein